jgi:hypothetical protein
MSVTMLQDTQRYGGALIYGDLPQKRIFWDKLEEIETKSATIKSGQVIKAYTFLGYDTTTYELVVHPGLAESSILTFNSALVSTNTVVVSITGAAASITFTVGTAGATPAQLASALAVLTSGITTTLANTALLAAGIATTVGTYTAMTVGAPDFNVSLVTALGVDTVVFNPGLALTNVTDLTIATTGTVHTLATKIEPTSMKPIAGVTMYDVDASSASVDSHVYTGASFWALEDGSDALRWVYDQGETLTKADGTTVALTPYNTGCAGTSAYQKRLKHFFVNNTEFDDIQTELESAGY